MRYGGNQQGDQHRHRPVDPFEGANHVGRLLPILGPPQHRDFAVGGGRQPQVQQRQQQLHGQHQADQPILLGSQQADEDGHGDEAHQALPHPAGDIAGEAPSQRLRLQQRSKRVQHVLIVSVGATDAFTASTAGTNGFAMSEKQREGRRLFTPSAEEHASPDLAIIS